MITTQSEAKRFFVDKLPARLRTQISDEDYERKIVGLLTRRFSTKVSKDPRAEGEWKHASRVLHDGDHYIVIMLDDAMTHCRSSWWQKLWGAWKR